MEGLKKLLEETTGNPKFSFKAQKQGVCEFCGEERELSALTVLEKMKGGKHPAISRSQEGLPLICETCSFIYSTISTTRPSKFFKERKIIIIEGDKYHFLEDLNQIKQMDRKRYIFIYPLNTSNFMPINFYDLKATVNPKKNLIINYTAGTVFNTFEIETDRLFEFIESGDKSIHIINSLRRAYKGGK